MPLTVSDGALLGAGMWCAALSTFYYKRRQTLPFKVDHIEAWSSTDLRASSLPDALTTCRQHILQLGLSWVSKTVYSSAVWSTYCHCRRPALIKILAICRHCNNTHSNAEQRGNGRGKGVPGRPVFNASPWWLQLTAARSL